MVALFVALLLILLVMYHAWIRKTPVLAGVMVPALIMLLYAAGVLFLAKRDKQRRLLQENQLRATADTSALSEIVTTPGPVPTPLLTIDTTATSIKTTKLTKTNIIAPILKQKEKLPPPCQKNLKRINNLDVPKIELKNKCNNPNDQSTTRAKLKNSDNNKSKQSSKIEKSLPRFHEVNESIKKREPMCLSRSLSAS